MGLAADFVLIVVAGLIGGAIARAVGLPLLVGYVVAGVVVGPHTAGPTVTQVRDIETLAEIGVALLLFSLGLEVSFRDLHAVRRVTLIGGPIQLLVTIGLTSLGAMRFLGASWTESLWLGAMASVSSTMIALKVMAAGGFTTTLASRVMVGMLLLQDMAVIPILVILPQLGNPENLASRVGGALAIAVGLLLIVYFAGTRLLPLLFRQILLWGSQELFLVAIVATAVGIGAGMHAAGFSFALGAFVAGLILSESEFSHQALSDVVPLRDIFGLLFFVTVGMLFEPKYALENPGLIAVAVLLILVGKAVIFGTIARAFGYRYMAPWIIGLGLSQIGEFSFVLARTGRNGGFVSKPMYDLALTVTVITMAASPLVSAGAVPLGRGWQRVAGRRLPESAAPLAHSSRRSHVIVGGYGRTGRAVAEGLRRAGIDFVVVESSYPLIADLREAGLEAIWGDVSKEEVLAAAGLKEARLVLLTMPDKATVELAVDRSHRLHPDLPVVARGTDLAFLRHLHQRGALTVQPEFEGGLEMVRQGLLHCGSEEDEVHRLIGELRRDFYRENAT